ncbi:MAG: hypothetical protein RMK57_11485 [Bryobacterales bacterium]|nr:hypothetical protein [Bryobacteraceae bacterium]MDW8355141.1 hypothetical protein [Bryobacterales bacterium]
MKAAYETQPTYDDVNLILRLYELRREPKLREARRWFASSFRASSLEDFAALCPPGSEPEAFFRMVVSYWEMTASFISCGVLNKELFFQSGSELLLVWEKIRDLLPKARESFKDPFLLRNLELVAQEYIEWMNRRAPEAYAAFAARVRGS